jgi:putative peptidoglycan lipid II flippase
VSEPTGRSLRARALHLAAISAIARIPGFLIPLLIAAVFGAGPATDAYFLAYGAVFLTGGTLAQGIESAIVHFSAAARESRGFEDWAARWALAVALVVWLAVVPIVALAAPSRLESSVIHYALLLTPLALLWPVCAAYAGGLVARWQIAQASGSLLWRGLGALLGLAAVPFGGGLAAVGIGLGAGELGRLIWLRFKLDAVLPAKSTGGLASRPGFASAASAQVLAGATGSTAPFVERILATTLGTGGVSLLEYASRLLVVPAVLFEGGLAPLLLARWSNDLAAGRVPTRREVWRAVGKGVLLAGLIAGILAVLAHLLVGLLLGFGRLSPGDRQAIGDLLQLLAIGFVATMGGLLLERFYLAQARNRRLAVLALVRVAVRLSVVVILLPRSGLAAFAIGYAAAEWIYFLALAGLAPHARPA